MTLPCRGAGWILFVYLITAGSVSGARPAEFTQTNWLQPEPALGVYNLGNGWLNPAWWALAPEWQLTGGGSYSQRLGYTSTAGVIMPTGIGHFNAGGGWAGQRRGNATGDYGLARLGWAKPLHRTLSFGLGSQADLAISGDYKVDTAAGLAIHWPQSVGFDGSWGLSNLQTGFAYHYSFLSGVFNTKRNQTLAQHWLVEQTGRVFAFNNWSLDFSAAYQGVTDSQIGRFIFNPRLSYGGWMLEAPLTYTRYGSARFYPATGLAYHYNGRFNGSLHYRLYFLPGNEMYHSVQAGFGFPDRTENVVTVSAQTDQTSISPDGNGIQDQLTLRLNQLDGPPVVDWKIEIWTQPQNGDAELIFIREKPVYQRQAHASLINILAGFGYTSVAQSLPRVFVWDGLDRRGQPVGDGAYIVYTSGSDVHGREWQANSLVINVDRTLPEIQSTMADTQSYDQKENRWKRNYEIRITQNSEEPTQFKEHLFSKMGADSFQYPYSQKKPRQLENSAGFVIHYVQISDEAGNKATHPASAYFIPPSGDDFISFAWPLIRPLPKSLQSELDQQVKTVSDLIPEGKVARPKDNEVFLIFLNMPKLWDANTRWAIDIQWPQGKSTRLSGQGPPPTKVPWLVPKHEPGKFSYRLTVFQKKITPRPNDEPLITWPQIFQSDQLHFFADFLPPEIEGSWTIGPKQNGSFTIDQSLGHLQISATDDFFIATSSIHIFEEPPAWHPGPARLFLKKAGPGMPQSFTWTGRDGAGYPAGQSYGYPLKVTATDWLGNRRSLDFAPLRFEVLLDPQTGRTGRTEYAITLSGLPAPSAPEEVREDFAEELEKTADMLLDLPHARFIIQAHSAEPGDDMRNLELTEQWAADFCQKLIDMGIEADRIESRGFGETEPEIIPGSPGYEQPYKNLRDQRLIIKIRQID